MKHLFIVLFLFLNFDISVLSHTTRRTQKYFVKVNDCCDTTIYSLNLKLADLQKKAKEKKHPSFYGGSYINENHIVLLIADAVTYSEILDLTIDFSSLQIKPCQYSYKELLHICEQLDDFFFRTSNRDIVEKKIGWSSTFLSIPDNRIYIRLVKCNKESIELFKKNVCDSSAFVFVEADLYIHI
ncbi:MAG: hypothetical protein LUH22_03875 [Bacteroides sp.]|nr:hypothetical protein [Bacteroides sp.]